MPSFNWRTPEWRELSGANYSDAVAAGRNAVALFNKAADTASRMGSQMIQMQKAALKKKHKSGGGSHKKSKQIQVPTQKKDVKDDVKKIVIVNDEKKGVSFSKVNLDNGDFKPRALEAPTQSYSADRAIEIAQQQAKQDKDYTQEDDIVAQAEEEAQRRIEAIDNNLSPSQEEHVFNAYKKSEETRLQSQNRAITDKILGNLAPQEQELQDETQDIIEPFKSQIQIGPDVEKILQQKDYNGRKGSEYVKDWNGHGTAKSYRLIDGDPGDISKLFTTKDKKYSLIDDPREYEQIDANTAVIHANNAIDAKRKEGKLKLFALEKSRAKKLLEFETAYLQKNKKNPPKSLLDAILQPYNSRIKALKDEQKQMETANKEEKSFEREISKITVAKTIKDKSKLEEMQAKIKANKIIAKKGFTSRTHISTVLNSTNDLRVKDAMLKILQAKKNKKYFKETNKEIDMGFKSLGYGDSEKANQLKGIFYQVAKRYGVKKAQKALTKVAKPGALFGINIRSAHVDDSIGSLSTGDVTKLISDMEKIAAQLKRR